MTKRDHFIFFCSLLSVLMLFAAVSLSSAETENKIIIVQNGGGPPLLGNSLESTVLAIASGVEYLELPVTITGDENLILFDSPTLNRITDVKTLFPEKSREDGNFYVIDFTLAEIRQLRTTDPFENGPLVLTASIPTLKEELILIKNLEQYFGRSIGLVFDIKPPSFSGNSLFDISEQLLELLEQAGYQSDSTIYIQSSDHEELQRLHSTLMPQKDFRVDLIQKIGSEQESQWVFTNAGLRIVSTYASAISLPQQMVLGQTGDTINVRTLEAAEKYGLKIFVQLVSNAERHTGEFEKTVSPSVSYFDNHHIDGIFTNSYRNTLNFLQTPNDRKIKDNSLPPFFQNLELTRSRQATTPDPVTPRIEDTGADVIENDTNKTFDLQ